MTRLQFSLLLLWLMAVVDDKGEDSFSTSQMFSFLFSFVITQFCIGHGSRMRGKIRKGVVHTMLVYGDVYFIALLESS